MTVRDMVKAIQVEVRDRASDLSPERASELLMQLTSLIGNINDEIRVADAEYGTVLLACYSSEETVNRAKIVAETTPAYQRKRAAKDAKELALQMIGSLKYYLKSKQDEMRLAR